MFPLLFILNRSLPLPCEGCKHSYSHGKFMSVMVFPRSCSRCCEETASCAVLVALIRQVFKGVAYSCYKLYILDLHTSIIITLVSYEGGVCEVRT